MPRSVLKNIHPGVEDRVTHYHRTAIEEIEAAIARDDVVVVGMTVNPHVKRARKALDKAGKAHTYLEYGGYHNQWKRRLAIKMWSGWPTFPMVFVKGQLIGGADEAEGLIASGELNELLAEG